MWALTTPCLGLNSPVHPVLEALHVGRSERFKAHTGFAAKDSALASRWLTGGVEPGCNRRDISVSGTQGSSTAKDSPSFHGTSKGSPIGVNAARNSVAALPISEPLVFTLVCSKSVSTVAPTNLMPESIKNQSASKADFCSPKIGVQGLLTRGFG